MSDSKVLSNEEVDAFNKASESKSQSLSDLTSDSKTREDRIALKSIETIMELFVSEYQKKLSTFLRKKIGVKLKSSQFEKLSEFLKNKLEKHVYTVLHFEPHSSYGLGVVDLPLLNYAIDLVFGGQPNTNTPVIESSGKIGPMIAEKIAHLAAESFSQSAKEFGKMTGDVLKTVTSPSLISKLNMDTSVYGIELSIFFGEVETAFSLFITEYFLEYLIPIKLEDTENISENKKVTWKAAMEDHLLDSYFTVRAVFPEINMTVQELVSLKEGTIIPIGDPTLVDISLNDALFFKGSAGQVNEKRVVKIISEI